MKFSILNTLIILGSLQGFLLALVFVTNKKFRKKSNLHLAGLIFLLSLLNFINALRETRFGGLYEILDYMPVYWFLFIPFTLYYFIQYLIEPDYQFSKKEYWLFLPIALQIMYQFGVFTLYMTDSPWLGGKNTIIGACSSFFEIFSMACTLIVLVLAIRKLNLYEKQLFDTYSNIESQSLNWLRNTLIVSLVLWALWAVPLFLEQGNGREIYYPLFLGQAFIMYWLGYATYARRDLFENDEILSEAAKVENTGVELSQKTDEHYQKLLNLIVEEKLFKNPELSMTFLAAKMKLSNGYLSQIINQKEGKNFFDFINRYRIEEVKKNLGDPNFDHFSILGIALDAGFKSKSTFNAVFKKMTGDTPSAYKRLLIDSLEESENPK